MDRRSLTLLLAIGSMAAAPGAASAASTDALLARADTGTLSDAPAPDLFAQNPKGRLSERPTTSGTRPRSGSGRSGTNAAANPAAATATSLPFTGSDPRGTFLLGAAAILVGAGLRLRTGDARDF